MTSDLSPLFLLFWLAANPNDYAGAGACAGCHTVESQSQSRTAHSRALLPALTGGPARWAFGAGVQAVTFVRRLDQESYLEEPESWYRAIDGYARTPGHRGATGVRDRVFDPSAAILRCFGCHSTGPLRVTEDRGIVPFEMGVRCEACHGAAAAHVRDPAKVVPQNPGRLSAEAINSLCGECHRMPMQQADETSLRNPWNARHQPLLLAASRCFRESGGRLTCLTCHRPHERLETAPARYDSVCAGCHQGVRHADPVAGTPCVSCHMPAVQPQPHLKFANHRIGVYGASDPLAPRIRRK
jgi:hypothetical protein